MDNTNDQNDAIINRINLQLARSRSILNSWRPQNQQSEQADGEPLDNDDDFKNFGEKGGIGSVAVDDESMLPTKRSTQKDKLLEQLIGKKAANAKRKEDAHKSMSVSKHAAPKPITNSVKPSKQEADSEDEDEGRAAAFKSKTTGKSQMEVQAGGGGNASDEEQDAAEDRPEGVLNLEAKEKSTWKGKESKEEARPQKRKAGGSYLDELLSKKAKKKGKKK